MMIVSADDEDWYNELDCENASELSLGVKVVDVAGNITLKNNLGVQCKVPASMGLM